MRDVALRDLAARSLRYVQRLFSRIRSGPAQGSNLVHLADTSQRSLTLWLLIAINGLRTVRKDLQLLETFKVLRQSDLEMSLLDSQHKDDSTISSTDRVRMRPGIPTEQ